MTVDQLRQNFIGHAALIDAMVAEGAAPVEILRAVVARIEQDHAERQERSHVA
jgi:hypothetical protein